MNAFAVAPERADAADSYRVNAGDTVMIDEHGICRMVTNNNSQDIFVPTRTGPNAPNEWPQFIANAPNITLSPCACILDGVTVSEGDSITAYLSSRPCADSCADIDQVRICTGGVLDGDSNYSKGSCPAMTPCEDCTTTDGVTVTHNTYDVLYNSQVVPCGSSCTGQSRLCYDGAFTTGTASYEYANCTIEMCPFSVVMDPTLGNDGTTTTQVTIPAGTGSFNYELRWRQGAGPTTKATGQTGDYVINLPSSDPVTVEIRGTFPHWGGDSTNYGVTDILRWGEIQWATMSQMFRNETGLSSYSAVDTPDLSGVTDMSRMFQDASNFNGDISGWDTSNITNMFAMFKDASAFNQAIGSWDVSNVTDMGAMFDCGTRRDCVFDQPLNSWSTSSVENLSAMFRWNQAFNRNLSSWDVANANDMGSMFSASPFNGDITTWNTTAVTDMANMFRAGDFNRDISSWDVSSVINMTAMFRDNAFFDQNISGWCVTAIPSKPTDFDWNTSAGWTWAEKPNWGTCPVAGSPCSLPWGGSISDGSSVTAYLHSSVSCGSSCPSETRTCAGGSLSGSYINPSCSETGCAGCSTAPVSWFNGCYGSASSTSHGGTVFVLNTNPDASSGSHYFECDNGSWLPYIVGSNSCNCIYSYEYDSISTTGSFGYPSGTPGNCCSSPGSMIESYSCDGGCAWRAYECR